MLIFKIFNYSAKLRRGQLLIAVASLVLASFATEDDSIQELINTLRSGELSSVRTAMVGLTHHGAAAVEPLIGCLNASPQITRISAVEALGHIGDSRALKPLLKVFKNDDYAVRWAVAEALGRIGDSAAVDALVEALPSAQTELRGAIVGALYQIGDPRAVPILVDYLKDENPETRISAARVVGRLGGATEVPQLLSCLYDGNATVRQAAAEALGRLAASEAVEPLIKLLKDRDPEVPLAAATALGAIGDSRAVTPLIATLQMRSAEQLVASAAALGNIKDPAGAAPLITLMRDDRSIVSEAAVAALKTMGAAAVPDLIYTLQDYTPQISATAALLLGLAGDPTACDALVPLLKHRNIAVRQNAAAALTALNYLPDSLDQQVTFYTAAGDWDALRDTGAPGFELLITRLQSESAEERILALTALENLSRHDITPLLNALTHTNVSVRIFIAEALGRAGDQEAIASLKNLQNDDNEYVRKYAARALNQLGEKVAIPEVSPIQIERAAISATPDDDAASAAESGTDAAAPAAGADLLGDIPLLTF